MLQLLGPTKIFFFLMLFSPVAALCQDWEKYSNDVILSDDRIDIFFRYINRDGSDYLEFKGETTIHSTLTILSAVIRDVESMHNWVYNVESASSTIISDTERFTYIVHKSIGLFLKKRDSYVHSFISQDSSTLEVTIKGYSSPDMIPKVDGHVRIERGESKWKFIPIGKNSCKVVFQGYADPGGWLSSSLLNPLAKKELWKLPYYSLRNLKLQTSESKYKNVEYSFIKNF